MATIRCCRNIECRTVYCGLQCPQCDWVPPCGVCKKTSTATSCRDCFRKRLADERAAELRRLAARSAAPPRGRFFFFCDHCAAYNAECRECRKLNSKRPPSVSQNVPQ